MSAPRTAREQVREEMAAEILAVARQHVAREGAAALSLRSIARDLEMAPSALYRYFDGRGRALECADPRRPTGRSPTRPSGRRRSSRRRARATRRVGGRCHEPCARGPWRTRTSGASSSARRCRVRAPEETVEPYARIVSALVRPIIEAEAAGRLQTGAHEGAISRELADAVAPVSDALFPHMPAAKVVLAIRPGRPSSASSASRSSGTGATRS